MPRSSGSRSAAAALPPDPAFTTVLVTGASGFIAQHTIILLLRAGYRVRGTLRSLDKADATRAVLAAHLGPDQLARLELVAAELLQDDGWREAVRGCRYVLHMASPLPSQPPDHEDELIKPAREGTVRVLAAAAAGGSGGIDCVERVVMTSSVAAVLYGLRRDGTVVHDESSWSELGPGIGAYEKSKTLAERAAWTFVDELPAAQRFELCTLNPGLALGPLLAPEINTSAELVRKLLCRELPGCPDLGWAMVDVRDVAAAHLAAMTAPEAAGKRFVLALEHADLRSVARILHEHYGARGYRVPLRRMPSWVLRLVALWDRTVRLAVQDLGKRQDVSSVRARELLGFAPRSLEEMVTATADSMIAMGLV